jgi:hypothetical protein
VHRLARVVGDVNATNRHPTQFLHRNGTLSRRVRVHEFEDVFLGSVGEVSDQHVEDCRELGHVDTTAIEGVVRRRTIGYRTADDRGWPIV